MVNSRAKGASGEEWKYSTNIMFEVSSLGRVRNSSTGRIRKPYVHESHCNYPVIVYKNNGKTSYFYVHKEVARAFIGESRLTVNHIDRDRANNCVNNLEYLSHSDNVKHSANQGAYSKKLTELEVREIRMWSAIRPNSVALAKKFGVSHVTILSILKGNTYKWVK